jgi:hypothetical protein
VILPAWRVVPAALAAAVGLAVSLPCAAVELDEVLAGLRGVPERHGAFEETKRMALLNGPLVRKGTLDYVRPDHLTMRVETPYYEKLDIAGDALTIERRSGVTRVALASQPQLAAWVESLRATLAGDRAALTTHFDVKVEGTVGDWRLQLVPRDPALAGVVAHVSISGRGAEVLRFEIDEVKGDTSRVEIRPR